MVRFDEGPWAYVIQMVFYVMVYFYAVLVLARCPNQILGVAPVSPARRERIALLVATALLVTGSAVMLWAGGYRREIQSRPSGMELETRSAVQMLADLARITWMRDGECPDSVERLLEVLPDNAQDNGRARRYFADGWGRPLRYEPFHPSRGYGRVWSEGRPGAAPAEIIEVRFTGPQSK